MVFSSNIFLFFFLPTVLAVYYLVPRNLRNAVLLLFSLVFYGWGEPIYLLLMLAVILFNYGFGRLIGLRLNKGHRVRPILACAVALNLLLLGWFKYAGFFARSLGLSAIPQVALPIGISFYIFQSMSYVIDVSRGQVPAQRDPVRFGTYVSMFPQLIAGPIVRYRDVARQLEQRSESVPQFAAGISLFIIGLAKKLLLANPMGALWDVLRAQPGTLSAWVGMFAYTFQIYFDFSGYSDMAIGLGRMFGFEFLKNFDYPYISASITEFWRRWHISLSTWFREYVYIPLGGNRCGKRRQLLNLLIVWALTGLWHGASWNFVLWGLYYAVLLILEKWVLAGILDRTPGFLRHVTVLILVALGWMLFYFEDMAVLLHFLARLVTPAAVSAIARNRILAYLPLLAVCAVGATPLPARLFASAEKTNAGACGRVVLLAALMILCTAVLATQSYNPFIYFRF